jgi:hypothetical protein
MPSSQSQSKEFVSLTGGALSIETDSESQHEIVRAALDMRSPDSTYVELVPEPTYGHRAVCSTRIATECYSKTVL